MELEKSGNSISHSLFYEYLEESQCINKWIKEQPIVQDDYLNFFPQWIKQSNLNKVYGAPTNPIKDLLLGKVSLIKAKPSI